MQEYSLPLAISALGDLIATRIPDDDELALLAAVLTQLGDTLTTILTIRTSNSTHSTALYASKYGSGSRQSHIVPPE